MLSIGETDTGTMPSSTRHRAERPPMTKQRRNTRTEAAIKSAFITLMKQKGLAAMTVSDIARLANINRGTFYTHYTDKFDLCQQLIDDAQNDLTAIMRSSISNNRRNEHGTTEVITYDTILACLQYIKQDYPFFDAISHSGNDMALYNKCKDMLAELLIMESAHINHYPQFADIPPVYAKEMLASSAMSAIWLWLKRGCMEPPETIAHLIDTAKHLAPMDLLQ